MTSHETHSAAHPAPRSAAESAAVVLQVAEHDGTPYQSRRSGDTVVKILGHANPRRAWCNASVVCSLPSALDSRIMSRAIRPSKHTLLRTRYTLFCIFR